MSPRPNTTPPWLQDLVLRLGEYRPFIFDLWKHFENRTLTAAGEETQRLMDFCSIEFMFISEWKHFSGNLPLTKQVFI